MATKIERERAKEKAIHNKLDKILEKLEDLGERQKSQTTKKASTAKKG